MSNGIRRNRNNVRTLGEEFTDQAIFPILRTMNSLQAPISNTSVTIQPFVQITRCISIQIQCNI